MREHPIPFKAPMVRAILEGKKSVTRRIAKEVVRPFGNLDVWQVDHGGPYFKLPCHAGDRLWVREDLRLVTADAGEGETVSAIQYAADGVLRADLPWEWKRGFLPARFMPRYASRITLEVTGVKVERLQDISEEGAVAEGVMQDIWSSIVPYLEDPESASAYAAETPVYWAPDDDSDTSICMTAREAFQRLWNMVHGKGDPYSGAWDDNPYVAAISFRRLP